VIGRCLALGRLLAEFSLTPGTPSFLGQNAARKVVGRWPRSSLATCATMFNRLSPGSPDRSHRCEPTSRKVEEFLRL
jgi:hypothetical protein